MQNRNDSKPYIAFHKDSIPALDLDISSNSSDSLKTHKIRATDISLLIIIGIMNWRTGPPGFDGVLDPDGESCRNS